MIYTITLNPSIDQHITINKLIKDDTLKAQSVRRDPGGKGINVSRVVKELGGQTKAFGIIGGCGGYMLRDLLDRKEIEYQFFEILGETRINFIMTDLSDKTQTRISAPGPAVENRDIEKFIEMIKGVAPRPSFWVLGGSLPPGVSKDACKKIIEYLQKKGEKCVLDADGEVLEQGIGAAPFFIKPNEFELERLLKRQVEGDEDIIKAAEELCHRYGIGIVAVSLGKRGAFFVTEKEAWKLETPDVEVQSKVGAGDSMVGGFLVALDDNQTLEMAARNAVAAGTAAVMSEGTQLCRREDVEKLRDLIPAKLILHDKDSVVQDIICGMTIKKSKASGQSRFGGQEYYFCSKVCQEKFDSDPIPYIRNEEKRSGIHVKH